MTKLDNLERYLKVRLAEHGIQEQPEVPHRRYPFVTISRQAGSGGHTLAKMMLEIFASQPDRELFDGWQIFDRELSEIVCRDPRFAASLDQLLEESYRTPTNEFIRQILRPTIDQDVLMTQVFRVVRALAVMGKTIIVGRGGSQVTQDLPLGVSVRLVAPDDIRFARIADAAGLDKRGAQAAARKLDAQRARLLRTHFRTDIADPLGYDAVWNAAECTAEEISQAVASLIRTRYAQEVHQDALAGESG